MPLISSRRTHRAEFSSHLPLHLVVCSWASHSFLLNLFSSGRWRYNVNYIGKLTVKIKH